MSEQNGSDQSVKMRYMNYTELPRSVDDGIKSLSSLDQLRVEKEVEKCFSNQQNISNKTATLPELFREKHLKYLRHYLSNGLTSGFDQYDASKPWMTYWITHGIALLGDDRILGEFSERIIKFLPTCSSPTGGYGGGPGQISHLATTYAAVNALVTLRSSLALDSINRTTLRDFLQEMRQNDGSFKLHREGEVDIRGAYCAVSIAFLCQLSNLNELFEKTGEWIAKCQSYEGGFGATPGNEAHGGYTFCALAALMLLNETNRINVKNLLKWIVYRQHSFEGGFAGRTNKLVDCCYSFWQGATLPMIHGILATFPHYHQVPKDSWLFSQEALQEYILCCTQDDRGGLIDKPEKHRDFYHTCYGLSGLSVAQHCIGKDIISGSASDNFLEPVHLAFNVREDAVQFAKKYFASTTSV